MSNEERERRKAEAKELAEQGVHKAEIARRLGVSLATVYRDLKSAEAEAEEPPQEFFDDVEKMVAAKDGVLAQLERCGRMGGDERKEAMEHLFRQELWLLRLLSTMFSERFEAWLSHLDGDLADGMRHMVEEIRWKRPWVRGEARRFRAQVLGLIDPPTGVRTNFSLDLQRGHPMIEEMIFSGERVISHIKWNLDDYVREIGRKVERCEEVLQGLQGRGADLEPERLEELSREMRAVLDRGRRALQLIEGEEG